MAFRVAAAHCKKFCLERQVHAAGKAAKQIEKIAVTSNTDFSIQHAMNNRWVKFQQFGSITFQENSILLENYLLREVGVVPSW